MDRQTLDAYERNAAGFAAAWEAQPVPSDMYELLRRFFVPGPSADIGCGSGRDAEFLCRHGFASVGYDASPALLAEARHRHPGIEFRQAALPELHGIAEAAFVNVLCETVIMHLPSNAVAPALARLLTILRPGGTLYLSWREIADDRRDDVGRFYVALADSEVLQHLAPAEILLAARAVNASSGHTVHRIVARKPGSTATSSAGSNET